MTERKKINWLLILQGWTMLWVVLGHAPLGVAGEGPGWENSLYNLAYSFPMSLFILISGYLFQMTRLAPGSKWKYGDMLADKALRLLVPMAVFTMVAFLLKVLLPSQMDREADLTLWGIVSAFLRPYNGPLREMWFIVTLFWMFILSPLWQWSLGKPWRSALLAALLLVLHYFHLDWEFLSLKRVFAYAFWFYCGILMSCRNIPEKVIAPRKFLFMVAGLVIYIAGLPLDGMICTAGAVIFSLALALALDSFLPRIFSSFRNYTYQIFLMGIFAQMGIKILYRIFDIPYIPAYLLCVAAGIYVPVLISIAVKRTGFAPLMVSIGLKPAKK